jgi:hypothetical protein
MTPNGMPNSLKALREVLISSTASDEQVDASHTAVCIMHDVDNRWCEVLHISGTHAIHLIRPDGHVAWRWLSEDRANQERFTNREEINNIAENTFDAIKSICCL